MYWRVQGGGGLLALYRCEKKDAAFCPHNPDRDVLGNLTAESGFLVLLNFGIKAK